MTNFRYLTGHLFPAWVQQWTYNFKHWARLMTDDYEVYDCPWCESPERECYEWFWTSINLDDTYSKEFLEALEETVSLIDQGKTELISFTVEEIDW